MPPDHLGLKSGKGKSVMSLARVLGSVVPELL